MILKKLILKNFRGYKNETININKDMNVIIGKNDVGKSTILEALDIFFNPTKAKIDINDYCVYADGEDKVMSISCCFKVEDDSIVIDSTNITSCKDEFILNKDGLLEIKQQWDCSKGKLTASSLSTYMVCDYPTLYEKPLLLEKINALQKKYDKYKDDPIYVPEKRTISAELRKAIYSKELVDPIEKELTDIDISKEGAKDIWTSLSKQLPCYFLFESDRKNTDKDSEIQDPLKAVTRRVIENMEAEIKKLQDEVKAQVEDIGKKTIDKLSELDKNIAKDIRPSVNLKPIDSSFSFDLISDDNIPLNKRGSGVRRLILLSYFRADAEEALLSNPNRQMIYAIEEPETSQHPDYQKMILETLIDLSQKQTHQILITTHTPEIAKMVDVNQIIFVKNKTDNTTYIECDEKTKIKEITQTLGILPYANTKTVIYVEGTNDVDFLTNLSNNIDELHNYVDFEQMDISIIPLQGSRLIDWINKNYFEGMTNLNEIYIVDNDVEKYRNKINDINRNNDGKRFGWVTSLPEMENYCPVELIEAEFEISLDSYKDTWKSRDIPQLLCGLCRTNITDYKDREKSIKGTINSKLSKLITKEMLEDTETWEEVENWFKKIAAIYNGTYVKKP